MRKAIDVTGRRVHHWTVLSFAGRRRFPGGRPARFYLARCDCGTEKELRVDILLKGRYKSCGCKKLELNREAVTVHGHARTGQHSPEYRIWAGMIRRCTDPKTMKFEHYGGRGIAVCDRWRHDFIAFLSDMGERPSPTHSIDRIDSNGNYEPGNCRWSTKTEQMRNTRSNHTITFRGETKCLAEWSETTGLTSKTIRGRLARGWTVEDALTLPAGTRAVR